MFLTYFFLGIVGLAVGSFLTAFTYRFPKKISTLSGRSFCPSCKKQIAWYDNIPTLSFLVLGGRCRNCRKRISWRYPLIELSTGLAFVGMGYFTWPWDLTLAFRLFIVSLLIFILIVDWETKIIPDEAVFLGFLVVVAHSLFVIPSSLFLNLAAGFLAADSLLFIHLITRGCGMGLGDVKFALLGGTLIGLKLVVVWLFLAFLTGAALGVILIVAGRAKLKSAIAFGPFLVISLPITFLFGEKLISWVF
jgi:prepilin signal peptidase PulO-like enzyme (type II secretory pathway)